MAKNLINLQVLALVGFRKAMDYFPSVFSQKELFWLDNLMPASNKKEKKSKKKRKEENSGTELVIIASFEYFKNYKHFC